MASLFSILLAVSYLLKLNSLGSRPIFGSANLKILFAFSNNLFASSVFPCFISSLAASVQHRLHCSSSGRNEALAVSGRFTYFIN